LFNLHKAFYRRIVLQEPSLLTHRKENFCRKRKLLCFLLNASKKENVISILMPSIKEKREDSNRIFSLISASVKFPVRPTIKRRYECLNSPFGISKNSQQRHASFQKISLKKEKLHRFSINSSKKKNLSTSMPCFKKIPKKNSKGLKLKRES